MSFTVTATAGGSTSPGIEMALLVFTGQAGAPFGSAPLSLTSATPSGAITPDITGSYIAGTQLATGILTALAGTTYFENVAGGGLTFGPFHAVSAAGGTPQTVGSSTGTGIEIVALEIKTTPALASSALSGWLSATSVTSAAITPAAGALLAAMVASNGGASVTTMSISDTSGLGLSWTEQVKQDNAGNGYAGIWTAVMPGGATASLALAPMSLAGQGTAGAVAGAGTSLALAPMGLAAGALTGGNVTATASLALAPMALAGQQARGGGAGSDRHHRWRR